MILIGYFNFRKRVQLMKISPDNQFIAIALDHALRIYEMPRLKKEFEPFVLYKNYTLCHQDDITSLCWSSDSRFVLSSSKDHSIRLMNLHKLKNYIPFLFTGHKKKLVNAVFSQDNMRIFSISKVR
jgi:periodic tryptophan protein 2